VSLVCPNLKEENRFGGKVRLTHNPNQCWSAYGLGIHDLGSTLEILCLGILHLHSLHKTLVQQQPSFPLTKIPPFFFCALGQK
jgi:hypothetical protein